MEQHKVLYKEQSLVLSPRNHSELNRQMQRDARAKQRKDTFQSNRVISISPTPRKPTVQSIRTKENENPPSVPPPTRISRQEQYLERFIKWKQANKLIKEQKQMEARGQLKRTGTQQTVQFPGSSTFRPPANLATKAEAEFKPPKRPSMYVVVKPKAKPKEPTNGVVKRVEPPVRHKPNSTFSKQPAATVKQTASKPANLMTKLFEKPTLPKPTATGAKTQPIRKLPAVAKPPVRAEPAAKPTSSVKKPLPAASVARAQPTRTERLATKAKPAPAKVAPVQRATVAKVVPARALNGGAAGKFKPALEAKTHPSRPQLSTRLKSKKPPANDNNKQHRLLKVQNLRQELVSIVSQDLPPNTPLEVNCSDNPFQLQVTSTHNKSNNNSLSLPAFGDMGEISPVVSTKGVGSSGAKRKLLDQVKSPEPKEKVLEKLTEENPEPPKRKFNFVRYSEHETQSESVEMPTLVPQADDVNADHTVVAQDQLKTPPRSGSSSGTYVSPFVSFSRGKVNSRSEREKRNSMYLRDPSTPLHVRLALEAVIYFRQQLSNEISRLHNLCDEWETYVKQHESLLLETGGLDMINVAIGQTKLLTSKKMMQFSGLIARCEAGAKGEQKPGIADGSEDSKPVEAKDLEGWWDMLKLQSDNVDKRFANLIRWRDNEWVDPDAQEQQKKEAKAKLAKHLKPKPKVKRTASSNLKQFLVKAHAELKKKKAEAANNELGAEEVNSSARRSQRVIVVRDRKSFSPARTVLSLSKGDTPRSSIGKGNAMLKSAIMAAAAQHAPSTPPPSLASKSRQSILKTPGTFKRETGRGVIFSATKKVRRFKFTIDEGDSSDEAAKGGDKLEDCEENMSLEESGGRRQELQEQCDPSPNASRTYGLRNRLVKLRPSSEFM